MKTQHIYSIIAVLLFALLIGYKVMEIKNPGKVADILKVDTSAVTNTTASNVTSSQIEIKTNPPIGAVRKGVIEVGASGFNSFVIDADKEGNWELVSKEFGESLAYEGFITKQDVQTGLKKYLSSMFEKGVNGKNAHFVVSSGALKNPKTDLIIKGIEGLGYVVNRVTAEEEGKYALKALLPSNYKDKGYVVDIGSGNTKVSWYQGSQLKSIESFGAKYYQNNTTDSQVIADITKAVNQVPQSQKQYCFIIGGVPFKLASANKASGRFQQLLPPSDYSFGDDVKLRSGLTIYKSIYEASGAESPTIFVFDWDANFTIGFLLSL